MENRTYEQIFKHHINGLVGLGDLLDNCSDLHDLGYVDKITQDRYNHLAGQSFLTIWALHMYFNGTDDNKEQYQCVYDEIIKGVPDGNPYKERFDEIVSQYSFIYRNDEVGEAINLVWDLLDLEITFTSEQYPNATNTVMSLMKARDKISTIGNFIREELNVEC